MKRLEVIDLVRTHPGKTATELMHLHNMPRPGVHRAQPTTAGTMSSALYDAAKDNQIVRLQQRGMRNTRAWRYYPIPNLRLAKPPLGEKRPPMPLTIGFYVPQHLDKLPTTMGELVATLLPYLDAETTAEMLRVLTLRRLGVTDAS